MESGVISMYSFEYENQEGLKREKRAGEEKRERFLEEKTDEQIKGREDRK